MIIVVILYCALAGHVMAVMSSGRPGDQVTLTSVLNEFKEPVSVWLEYRLQEFKPGTGGTLSVYLLSKLHVPTRVYFREWNVIWNGWQRGCFSIPTGTYRVMFLATLGLPYHSDIYLDNIEFRQGYACYGGSIMPTWKPPTGNIIFLLRNKFCETGCLSQCRATY